MTTDYELRAQRSGLFPARLLSAVAVSMLLTCCLLVSGAAGAGTKAKSPVVVKVVTTKLGKTLVDAKGMTLYLLTADSRAKGKSVCYGTCAKYWPPLLATRTPKAGSGAKQALLGVAKRTGGTSQVTYRGHRLYLFKKDTKPGQVNGQRLHGFGGPFCTANLASKPCAWYAVSPSGSAITRTVNSGVQATATARNTVVTVTAGKPSEFKFKLSKARVPVGTVTFKITNKGALAHDFKVCSKGGLANTCTGKSSSLLTPRKSESLTVAFKKKGSYEYLCTVPGHAAAGMKGDLKVIPSSGGAQ